MAATLVAVQREHPSLHERLARLDPHQQRAIFSDDPVTLVQAQVGSGKTTVLVHKLLWLHLVRGVGLSDVAVLTFTRRAADEVRTRVAELGLDSDEAGQLLGTFHGVARALLARALPVHELGFSPSFGVLDARGREALLERLIDAHGLSVKYRSRLSRRWEGWRRGQRRFGNMKRDDDMGRLVALYADAKRRRDLMDFDDLLENATRLLPAASPGERLGAGSAPRRGSQGGGGVLERPPAWILIDELQDCDSEQVQFALRLCGPETRLFAVGDPDQSIYSWRGGSPQQLTGLGVRRRARVLDLPRNYRSTATIVAGARALLGGRTLVATRPAGEPLAVIDHHDPQSEVAYLARRLPQLRAGGSSWSEVALLVRTQQQLEPLAEGLARAGIPCALRGVGEGPAVRWLRCVLRAALQGDALDARAALTHERYGLLAPRRLRKARAWCEARGEAGLAGLSAFLVTERGRLKKRKQTKREAAGSRDPGLDLRAAQAWCARLAELPAWLEAHHDDAWDARLIEHLELPLALGPTRSTQPRDLADVTRWLAQLRLACRRSGRFDAPAGSAPAGSAPAGSASASSLGACVLACMRSRRSAPSDLVLGSTSSSVGAPPGAAWAAAVTSKGDAVSLMTIHASKGLEFRHVFVCGVNDGLLPLASAWRSRASLAEERRLFFVALTRARDSVEFSWYRAPTRPDVRPEPSVFLSKLPERWVVRLDAAALAERCGEQTEPAASAGWSVGERVKHKKYGVGTIVAVEGARLRCAFPAHGEKPFFAALCPLERAGPAA